MSEPCTFWPTPEIGDRFFTGHSVVVVTRRSITHGWVDIAVQADNGARWTKRMPKGIPSHFKAIR